jgi:DNA-directed RNA polymerase subunit beta
VPYPDFLDVQIKSFQDFFQLETTPENRKNEGLFQVFAENFPITDARNNFVLEFWIISLILPAIALKNVSSVV